MELFLFATGLALGVSFLCSIFEASLLSLTPVQINQMEGRAPRSAAIWKRFKAGIDKPLAVILILNTTAHTIGATIAGAEFSRLYGDERIFIFSLIFTLAMLQFTEVLPKSLGVRYNLALAPLIAAPLDLLTRVLAPFLALVHFLNKPFQGKVPEDDAGAASLAELASMARLARSTRAIGAHEQRIITGATALRTITTLDLMVPRTAMVTVSSGTPVSETMRNLKANSYSHLPVIDAADPGRCLGFVDFEDLAFLHLEHGDATDLGPLTRPIQRIRHDVHAGELLRLFSESGDPIALVIDAEGRMLGLVSVADVIEELMGEMHDRDELPRTCLPRPNGFLVGGGLPMAELAQRCAKDWPDIHAQTLVSDWLAERLGDPLTLGRVWSEGDIRFTVRRLRSGRIAEVEVRLP